MIPKTVKVGHMIYKIETTDEVLLLNNIQCKGIIDYESGTIKLAGDKVHGEYARYQTMWHEIFHGFVRDRGMEFEDEENVVDEFGKVMAAFCMDNGLEFKNKNVMEDVKNGK